MKYAETLQVYLRLSVLIFKRSGARWISARDGVLGRKDRRRISHIVIGLGITMPSGGNLDRGQPRALATEASQRQEGTRGTTWLEHGRWRSSTPPALILGLDRHQRCTIQLT